MRRIVLVGDYDGTSAAHRAIPNALAMAAHTLHAETNPDAHDPVIAPLMCSLLEVKGALHFEPGSRLAEIDGRSTATEECHCSFGLNPMYAERRKSGLLKVPRATRCADYRPNACRAAPRCMQFWPPATPPG